MPNQKQNGEWRPRPRDLVAAAGLLTRVPVPRRFSSISPDCAWAWPAVGAALGIATGIVAEISILLGMSEFMASALAIAFLVAATGALHEDGIADSADGLGGGGTADQRLKIMRDSRIGAFGAVAIVVLFLGRWSAIADLAGSHSVVYALAATCAVSRAVMAAAMHLVPPARNDGLAAAMGAPCRNAVIFCIALAGVISAACFGWNAIPLLAFSGAAAVPVCWLAFHRIGGQTGDILGAAQQCSEIAALIFLAAVL
ncbi:MAG: adenosylcobinamide-GDP ribazoletransferase [Albidovulum sp.]|nr:adenosylcobinamide-GDP ribazoletransferase [Albidovulum sp.]